MNYKLCCLLVINILISHPSTLLAQDEQIKSSFSSDFSSITLDGNSVEVLRESGVDQDQLERILEVVQSYQLQRDEALGIEILTNFNSVAKLAARPDLGPREIAISPGVLMELTPARHPRYISPWDIHVQRFIPLGRLIECPSTSYIQLQLRTKAATLKLTSLT